MDTPPLAFVDVETTGVNPRENRITEIGVITVDSGGVREWTTVINPSTRRQERTLTPEEITDEMRMGFGPRASDFGQRQTETKADRSGRSPKPEARGLI